jgi:hypothetical protein
MGQNLENYESNLQETTGVYKQMLTRTILKLQGSNRTTNENLRERARRSPVEQELKYRRWRWLSHTLRRPCESITIQAFS